MPVLVDRSLRLPETEYFAEPQAKTGIAIHHTVCDSVRTTVGIWLRDKAPNGERSRLLGLAVRPELARPTSRRLRETVHRHRAVERRRSGRGGRHALRVREGSPMKRSHARAQRLIIGHTGTYGAHLALHDDPLPPDIRPLQGCMRPLQDRMERLQRRIERLQHRIDDLHRDIRHLRRYHGWLQPAIRRVRGRFPGSQGYAARAQRVLGCPLRHLRRLQECMDRLQAWQDRLQGRIRHLQANTEGRHRPFPLSQRFPRRWQPSSGPLEEVQRHVRSINTHQEYA